MDSRLNQYEEKLNKAYNYLKNEFQTIKAGRANPKILDKIMVDYYGAPTPINQMASINIPEARILNIQPFDKTQIKEIEKAINAANIGINPTNDGNSIRLIFPELTEERRKEISKDIKKLGEESKITVRNIRKEAFDMIKKLEKDSEITEDQSNKMSNDFQKEIDNFVSKIEKEVEDKTKEIMKV